MGVHFTSCEGEGCERRGWNFNLRMDRLKVHWKGFLSPISIHGKAVWVDSSAPPIHCFTIN